MIAEDRLYQVAAAALPKRRCFGGTRDEFERVLAAEARLRMGETNAPGAGAAMREGMKYLQTVLAAVSQGTLAIVIIG